MESSSQSFTIYNYANGAWTPSTPVLAVGESAFVTVLPCTNCITIACSNLLASVQCGTNCVIVPLTATPIDSCCSNVTLQYYEAGTSIPASGTCFNVGTTPVTVVATDGCGNSATNAFDVIIQQVGGTITIYSTNETVFTCSNCTMVPFQVTVLDPCCTNAVTVSYNYPTNYCFPVSTTTPVTVFATDGCGNAATNTFDVTVIQNTNPPVILSCPTNITICTNTGTGAIIVDSDEWALSDQGFGSEGDGALYAANCAAWLTGERGTNILIYSSDFGLDGAGKGVDFINALKSAGYNVTLDTPPTPTLTASYLSGFNAVL